MTPLLPPQSPIEVPVTVLGAEIAMSRKSTYPNVVTVLAQVMVRVIPIVLEKRNSLLLTAPGAAIEIVPAREMSPPIETRPPLLDCAANERLLAVKESTSVIAPAPVPVKDTL